MILKKAQNETINTAYILLLIFINPYSIVKKDTAALNPNLRVNHTLLIIRVYRYVVGAILTIYSYVIKFYLFNI